MLKSRWLSTFTVIGVVLIALGITGLILGPHFVFDPGQPVTGKEAWCYLAIGVLMVVNGVLLPAQAEEKQPTRPAGKNGQKAASEIKDTSKVHEVAVSTVEHGTESKR